MVTLRSSRWNRWSLLFTAHVSGLHCRVPTHWPETESPASGPSTESTVKVPDSMWTYLLFPLKHEIPVTLAVIERIPSDDWNDQPPSTAAQLVGLS